MEEDMKQKKIIIGVLCLVVCIMAVGFAAFSTTLNINGTASIESNWSVEFTNIQEVSKSSGVSINNPPTASGTSATFDVDLESPGDNIEYQITVENKGTLDAIISNINASETGSDAIKFEISNIKVGDKLASKTSTTFNITISYDESITSQPEITNNKLTVSITYVQDVGQEITPSVPEIQGPTLVNSILEDNTPQSDASIDFSQISSDSNGKGLYYTNTNTEDNKTTYYFRGAVENNYVQFANHYWRIIRINEDGSIRLIYQGETPNATGDAATIGESKFNSTYNDNAHVGYMYGETGASTYSATHVNTNDSTIKGVVDTWYEENLISYSSYLADSGFCGDRSIASTAGIWDSSDTALGYGRNETYYGAYNRLDTNKAPQFSCPQSNDLYTTSSSTKGNKALDYPIGLITADEVAYPIGLITADEVAYAGGIYARSNNSYYLNTGDFYWTMSPRVFERSFAYGWLVALDGLLNSNSVSDSGGVRPVINLVSGIEITGGDGTSSNPYVIKTN